MTLQFKYNSEALSSMKVFFDERLEKISNNNRIAIKFDTARKKTEELFNKIFDKFKAEANRSIEMKDSAINEKILLLMTNL